MKQAIGLPLMLEYVQQNQQLLFSLHFHLFSFQNLLTLTLIQISKSLELEKKMKRSLLVWVNGQVLETYGPILLTLSVVEHSQ